MEEKIAYQNKDIACKVFAETFGTRSLRVFGLDLPPVVRLLPTNLPLIQADELRLDELFELADHSVAIVDYESTYSKASKVKYAKYLVRVAERFLNESGTVPVLHMGVVYTADVTREQVASEWDREGILVRTKTAFLCELDSDEIRQRLTVKVERGEPLTANETMEFIILPLTYRGKEKKLECLKESVTLAAKVENRQDSRFVLSGLMVFTDKIIDVATREKIRRLMDVTQIGKMYLEEKEEAVRLARIDAAAEAKLEGIAEGKAEGIAEGKAEGIAEGEAKGEAKMLVNMVEQLAALNQMSAEEFCRNSGISVKQYTDARALLEQIREEEEAKKAKQKEQEV